MPRLRRARSFFLIIVALAAALILLLKPEAAAGPGGLKVYLFDVGQGDAAMIETQQGKRILVDGGPQGNLAPKLGEYLPLETRAIDIVILTHPHMDHMAGFLEVLERYEVGEAWYTGVPHTTYAFEEWLRLIKEKKVRMRQIDHRETITLDELTFKVLYPDHDLSALEGVPHEKGGEPDNLNNTSIVFRLEYGQTSFLFTGDAEEPVEKQLLKDGALARADVLKVSHHGSSSGSHWEFLEAVAPKFALIGVGKGNSFGHPHRRLLRRLERAGAAIYRTDIHGDILVESDGKEVRVRTEK